MKWYEKRKIQNEIFRAFILCRNRREIRSSKRTEIEPFATSEEFFDRSKVINGSNAESYLPPKMLETRWYPWAKLLKSSVYRPSEDYIIELEKNNDKCRDFLFQVLKDKKYITPYKKWDGKVSKTHWTRGTWGYWNLVVPYKTVSFCKWLGKLGKWVGTKIVSFCKWLWIKLGRILDLLFAGVISAITALALTDNKTEILSWIYDLF